jgi:hypothetical protein
MKANPILDEIRAQRDAHARRFNYDFDAIFADLQRQQKLLKAQGWKFKHPLRRRPPVQKSVA